MTEKFEFKVYTMALEKKTSKQKQKQKKHPVVTP